MSSQEMKTSIHLRLVQSGEKEKLKEHLRMRLIESGWRDQVITCNDPSGVLGTGPPNFDCHIQTTSLLALTESGVSGVWRRP